MEAVRSRMYLALHGRGSAAQRGTAIHERKRAREAETGERATQATEIENVAGKLSETGKVKPVSAV